MAVGAKSDFNDAPFIAIWEVTQACDLACQHCRASAHPERSSRELSTCEGKALLRQVRELAVPVFVLTGGDPMKRPDIFHLVEYGTQLGVRVSMTPSTTPLLTREAIRDLKASGLARLAVSIDGATAAVHDHFRRVPGAFARALDTVRWAREVGLPAQINTTIGRHNGGGIEAMAALMETLDIVLWSVFFLIPVGRGRPEDCLDAENIERVFAQLYAIACRVRFDVKTTEAMHYRRYLLQQRARERASTGAVAMPLPWAAAGSARAPRGLNDGKGFIFISYRGEVYPSGFLPLSAGNVRRAPLGEIYRTSPLLRALRDATLLEGKCGVCEFREICGGSRARAYAVSGSVFAADPGCVYEPPRWLNKGL
ncbi:MAG: TIGR04053 family radical SAM/SPASM domain-containing protein [Acidobacteria bacterium]|nr:MAG: TIGR04053 family radical SAM/SPASM domain-containing protein [Acidobacteriota bacterium]